MDQDEYREYLKSQHWQEIRAQRLKIDGGKCALCMKGPPERNVHVHHLSYENIWNEDVYSDLITVCDKCHKKLHTTIPYFHNGCSTEDLYVQLCNYNLDRFIESYESDDYVHNGDLDLCNINVIRSLLRGFYPIRINMITSYFGNLRREAIRDWKKKGYTFDQICNGSKFSKNMIKKTFYETKKGNE